MAIVAMMLAAASPVAEPLWEMVPPVPVHDEPCTLPAAQWGTGDPGGGSQAGAHRVSISFQAGKVAWNGIPIDEAALRSYVRVAATLQPRPSTMLFGAGVACAEVRRIAALIHAESNCSPSHCFVTFAPTPALVPRPPAPPAPPPIRAVPLGTGKAPTPRGSPQSWVTNDDYPDEAVRQYWTGAVGFRLRLDTRGRVSNCEITSGSGYRVLDETACALLKRRARFNPATDEFGGPIESSWSSRFRWQLPSYHSPLASWGRVTRYRVDALGAVSLCSTKEYGPASDEEKWDPVCGDLDGAVRDPSKWGEKTVWVEVRETHRVDRSPLRIPPPATGELMFSREIRYGIGSDGKLTGCRVVALTEADGFDGGGYYCHSALEYPRDEVARKPGIGVTYTVSIIMGTVPD